MKKPKELTAMEELESYLKEVIVALTKMMIRVEQSAVESESTSSYGSKHLVTAKLKFEITSIDPIVSDGGGE